ncbi:MAG: hypothetical protein E7314_04350 [Clostridiales bacterium]|nr:hypothetical protein [Clostridiales bacterium]
MKKISLMLIAIVIFMGIGTISFAADTIEEALGEVNILPGGVEMDYLIAGRGVQKLKYAYYNYTSKIDGENKEIPAYCVNVRPDRILF